MVTPANRYVPPVAIFTAATLFFSFAYAVIMGWAPMLDAGDIDRAMQSRPEQLSVPEATRCDACGVIESVREIGGKENPDSGSALPGGSTGAGRPHSGSANADLLTVIVAVFGAMAGNHYPKGVEAAGVHEITVRFDDGSRRVLTARNPQPWKSGDRVKIIGRRIHPGT